MERQENAHASRQRSLQDADELAVSHLFPFDSRCQRSNTSRLGPTGVYRIVGLASALAEQCIQIQLHVRRSGIRRAEGEHRAFSCIHC